MTHSPGDPAGELIREIGRFRDAVLLHAGELPYREYPMEWVLEQLAAARFSVTSARRFPIRYKSRFVNSQIDMCASRLAKLPDRNLAQALHARGETLRQRALLLVEREDELRHGFDYPLSVAKHSFAPAAKSRLDNMPRERGSVLDQLAA